VGEEKKRETAAAETAAAPDSAMIGALSSVSSHLSESCWSLVFPVIFGL